MQFAINYSPQAADLLQGGAVTIDRFKCSDDWPQLIPLARAHRPIYIHFNHAAAPEQMRALDVDAVNALCEETGTPYVNLHLVQWRDAFAGMPNTTTDPADRAAIHAYMLEGVQIAVELFGADRVIVENVPYYGPRNSTKRPCVELDIINAIVEATGVGFLLDVSHARLAAQHMGMDPYEYLAQLPGDRLRELHITGIGHKPNGDICDHMPLTSADWPFVAWVLDRIQSGVWSEPWIMAFEYGGLGPIFEWRSEADVIAAQVPRLVALAHAE